MQEEFEGTKGVIRIHKSKKDKQRNLANSVKTQFSQKIINAKVLRLYYIVQQMSNTMNRISGVIVSMLVSIVVDRGFELHQWCNC